MAKEVQCLPLGEGKNEEGAQGCARNVLCLDLADDDMGIFRKNLPHELLRFVYMIACKFI